MARSKTPIKTPTPVQPPAPIATVKRGKMDKPKLRKLEGTEE